MQGAGRSAHADIHVRAHGYASLPVQRFLSHSASITGITSWLVIPARMPMHSPLRPALYRVCASILAPCTWHMNKSAATSVSWPTLVRPLVLASSLLFLAPLCLSQWHGMCITIAAQGHLERLLLATVSLSSVGVWTLPVPCEAVPASTPVHEDNLLLMDSPRRTRSNMRMLLLSNTASKEMKVACRCGRMKLACKR